MSPPPLAQELIQEVLSHLSLDDPYSFQALENCFRVSRTFRVFSLNQVFSSVTLYMGCPRTFHPRWRWLASFEGFHQMLVELPHLGVYVRELVMVFHPFRIVWNDARWFGKICGLLQKVTGSEGGGRVQSVKIKGLSREYSTDANVKSNTNVDPNFTQAIKDLLSRNPGITLSHLPLEPPGAAGDSERPNYQNSPADVYGTKLVGWRFELESGFFSRLSNGVNDEKVWCIIFSLATGIRFIIEIL
jgi:hypothetical protein